MMILCPSRSLLQKAGISVVVGVALMTGCNPAHGRPADTSPPAPVNQPAAGDAEQKIAANTRSLLSFTFNTCGNGRSVTVTMTGESTPTHQEAVQGRLNPSDTSACNKSVQVSILGVSAGVYDLDAQLAASETNEVEEHKYKVTAVDPATPSPPSPPVNQPVTQPSSTDLWPGEASHTGGTCDGVDCQTTVANFVDAATTGDGLTTYADIFGKHPSGTLKLMPSATSRLQGTYELVTGSTVESGDYVARNGHLALRPNNGLAVIYLEPWVVSDNNIGGVSLYGHRTLADGDEFDLAI